MHENLLSSKLSSHHISKNANSSAAQSGPTQVTRPSLIPKPSQPTAKEILGLRRPRANKTSQKVSLETEVDQYLSDTNEGTGIMEFWQVWFYFLFYQLT